MHLIDAVKKERKPCVQSSNVVCVCFLFLTSCLVWCLNLSCWQAPHQLHSVAVVGLCVTLFPSLPSFKQNKMEDHLDEAIHVLRSHAVGQTNHRDIHDLLASASAHSTSVGSLSQSFSPASVLPIASRHTNLVR